MTTLGNMLQSTGLVLLHIIGACILIGAFWVVQDRITHFDDKAERAKGNNAAWISRIAGSAGIVIASAGSLVMSDAPPWTDLGMFMLDGGSAIVVFSIAMAFIFDRVVLPDIKNTLEIERGNKAVALFEGFGFLAMGCIMCGSFAGGGTGLIVGQLSGLAFGLIGAITLMLTYLIYTSGWRILRKCHIDQQIERGNIAAAIDAGSLILAMGIVLMFNIMGDFTGWGHDFASYAFGLPKSIIVVFFARALALKTFARRMGRTINGEHHGNVMKSLVVGSFSITGALVAGLVIVG